MSGIRGERDRRDGEHGREMCDRRAVGFRDRTRTIDESRPARVVHPFVRFGAARRRMISGRTGIFHFIHSACGPCNRGSRSRTLSDPFGSARRPRAHIATGHARALFYWIPSFARYFLPSGLMGERRPRVAGARPVRQKVPNASSRLRNWSILRHGTQCDASIITAC